MDIFKDKNKRQGLIGTAGFHLLLLIVFFLYGLTYMVPPPPEISMEVDFGFSDSGLGQVEEMQEASQQAEQETDDRESSSPSEASAATEETVTQAAEKTTTVRQNRNPEEKPKETVEEKEKDPQPSEELQKRLSRIRSSQKEDARSEGDTKGTGNMGNPEGTDSPNKSGYPGSGDFLQYRELVKKVRPKSDCPIGGTRVTVLMEIIVNQNGDVIRANPDYKGSTTTDPCLVSRAREAAMESRWNRDLSAPPEQKGYFSYTFVPQ